MGTVTAIECQKKRGNRRSVFVDGEFVAGVHEEVIAALNLRVGQELDPLTLAELTRMETLRKARESALRLINYRDRSVSELRRRLVEKGYPEDVADEVIDRFCRAGLLDDGNFSRDWVKARMASKPMGKSRLAWELRSKGVAAATVEEALENLGEEEEESSALESARARLEKMNPEDPSLKKRLGYFLRRRGFGWEVINRVLNELVADIDD